MSSEQPSPEFQQGQLPGTNPAELEEAAAKAQKERWQKQYGVESWGDIAQARLAELNAQAEATKAEEKDRHLHVVKDDEPEADTPEQN